MAEQANGKTTEELAADRDIRVVILSGAGRGFCAGHDLKQMTAGRRADDGGKAYFTDLFTRCTAVMAQIRALPQPVIAQIHGIATAAGCQLVATCALAVAAEDAEFGVNGVNIGLFCSTPMVALSRNVPRKQAFEMLTTGRFVTSGQAVEIGLINQAVPADRLTTAVLELAETIAAKPGGAIKIGKRAFYDQLEVPVDQAYGLTGAAMVENMLAREAREGIVAFLEKRLPDWDQTP
ncbi:MAG: enoyl-CoA hydratase [Pseudomonadota bacterium]